MNIFLNKKWWSAALARSLKTFCQTAVATISTSAIISDVDWLMVASASALAALLSILTSVAGIPEVKVENEALPIDVHPPEDVEEQRGNPQELLAGSNVQPSKDEEK